MKAAEKRLGRQDEAKKRALSKKEKKLARLRLGEKLLNHSKNHANDPEDQALGESLGERLEKIKDSEDDTMANEENEENEEDDDWDNLD